MTRAPAMQDLSDDLARAARTIATRLAQDGARAWIVGGVPRDLALGLVPTEVDMASRVEPDRIAALFPRTTPLGRAFGTVIVHLDGVDVEHTTFRTETGYSDARHPDAVRFGASVEEDARRRDFTCNAIYLDPLTGAVADPVDGLGDLARRRLACVGDPRARFREDALRPLRMARFAGGLGLEPDPATAEAARLEAGGLAAVSRERILRELEGIFRRRGAAVAAGWMARAGLDGPALPGLAALGGLAARLPALERLAEPAGIVRGLAVACGPRPDRLEEAGACAEIVRSLKSARATQIAVEDGWRLAGEMLLDPAPVRSVRVRAMRRAGFEAALAWLGAWSGAADPRWSAWRSERASLGAGDIEPPRLLDAADLARAGVTPGPRYGELLRELETEQLDLRVVTRADALAWLARRTSGA